MPPQTRHASPFALSAIADDLTPWYGAPTTAASSGNPDARLRTYVHLMDGGLGDAEALDPSAWGNPGATEAPKTAANEDLPEVAEAAV